MPKIQNPLRPRASNPIEWIWFKWRKVAWLIAAALRNRQIDPRRARAAMMVLVGGLLMLGLLAYLLFEFTVWVDRSLIVNRTAIQAASPPVLPAAPVETPPPPQVAPRVLVSPEALRRMNGK